MRHNFIFESDPSTTTTRRARVVSIGREPMRGASRWWLNLSDGSECFTEDEEIFMAARVAFRLEELVTIETEELYRGNVVVKISD